MARITGVVTDRFYNPRSGILNGVVEIESSKNKGQTRLFNLNSFDTDEKAEEFFSQSFKPGNKVTLLLDYRRVSILEPENMELVVVGFEFVEVSKKSYPVYFFNTIKLNDILAAAEEMQIDPKVAVKQRLAVINEMLKHPAIWTEHIQPLEAEKKRLELYLVPPKKRKGNEVPQEAIDFAKECSIEQVADFQKIPGTNKKAMLCPFHDDKTPSFELSSRLKGKAKCFACGATADAVKYICKTHGLEQKNPKDFLQAVLIINRLAGGPYVG